jgi:hypothetical protein
MKNLRSMAWGATIYIGVFLEIDHICAKDPSSK